MKLNWLRVILLALVSVSVTPLQAIPFGVAATVDGENITERKLQVAIDGYMRQQGTDVGAIRDPKRFKTIRNKLLDVLIGQELMWQAANKAQTIADDDEINQAMEQYQSTFRDKISFEIKIQEGGYNRATFRDNLKQQLSARKWIEKIVLKDVTVSDSEIHNFYLEYKQQFVEEEKIRARHILIKLKPDASNTEREGAITSLVEIRQKVESGASFETMAQDHSQDSSAPQGGDLGYFQRGQMVPNFEQAAFNLVEPGEVSAIVETQFGVHLIQLVDKKPLIQKEEAEAADQIQYYLWQQKYQQAVENAVEKLKNDAVIEKSNL